MDPALIRPGRVDVKQYIGHATEYQLYGMFKNFYPEEDEKLAQEFAKRVLEISKQISTAQIQGFFMLFKNDPQKALKNIHLFQNK